LSEIHDKVIKVFALADTGPSLPSILMSTRGAPAPSTHLPAAEHDLPAAHAPQLKFRRKRRSTRRIHTRLKNRFWQCNWNPKEQERTVPANIFARKRILNRHRPIPIRRFCKLCRQKLRRARNWCNRWRIGRWRCKFAPKDRRRKKPAAALVGNMPHCLPCAEQLLQVPGQ